jgi:hypothetical protein
VEYPNVKNAHIVPRTCLANWAIDRKIAVWLIPEGSRVVVLEGMCLDDQAVENVGTRRRFYERTLMHAAGNSLEEIGDFVGHSSTYMVDRYRHLIEGQRERAADRLDAFLTSAHTGAQGR